MAKRSKKRKLHAPASVRPGARARLSSWAQPVLLALVAFFAYWPSLKSDFVYDARFEMTGEGFITSLANLPDVLSLKVLGMHLILADRPGQLLYLMLNAAIWGKNPWGFHLASNLLHAANVALLFVILRRLLARELNDVAGAEARKIQFALVAVTLIFALHPIAVEPVSAINYSSDLLVTFFTLLVLLAATLFRPQDSRGALVVGSVGVFCCFAAVTCKESGVAAPLLLIAYRYLFRRGEKTLPWLVFLGASAMATAAFLAARFQLAAPMTNVPHYLGGSLAQVILIQPRLWVFMWAKLIWPARFSADYTLSNLDGISAGPAWAIFVVILLAQAWLCSRSRVGALGVLTFWLGLLTVSNFIPLYRVMADRFYYLPLAGVALQLLALYVMIVKSRWEFWAALATAVVALIPFMFLTLQREKVFASDFSLWSDTVQVSPGSATAHNDLGMELFDRGDVDGAKSQWEKALAINPDDSDSHNDMGMALFAKGDVDAARAEHQRAIDLNPYDSATHNNLGIALFHEGKVDEAIAHYQAALQIKPDFVEAHYDLGNALLQKGLTDDAIAEYRKALQLKPSLAPAECNLGSALLRKGQKDEAIAHYRKALEIDPGDTDAQTNLNNLIGQNQNTNGPSPNPR